MPLIYRSVRTAACGLVAAVSAGAQTWSVGVKGGVGQGSYTSQPQYEWEPTTPAGSAFVTIRRSERLAMQIEVLVAEKLGIDRTVAGSTTTFSASFVEVPIYAKYLLPGAVGVQPYLMAGPALTYRIGCNFEVITGGIVSNGPCDGNTFGDKVDFGGSGALGFSRPLGAVTVLIEARGTANLRQDAPLASSDARGRSWAVVMGMSVPLRAFTRTVGPASPRGPRMADASSAPVPDLPALDIAGTGLRPLQADSPAQSPAPATKRITLTAANADARALLLAIAKEAGISMVVSDDVRRRVSVSLTDASAEEAIAAIVAQAGLSVARGPAPTLPPVVYYQLPVNVNQAPAEAIAARFGVSLDMARWIAESRGVPIPR